MSDNDPVRSVKVSELCNASQYIIPIYQRSYAWGKLEIEQLIDDIWDYCKKGPQNPYYIGSLVVYKRKDYKLEVVDGQQRLTTLKILLSALDVEANINLDFESRKQATETLSNLHTDVHDDGVHSITNAFDICKDKLKEFDENKKAFESYLKEHVILIQTALPPGTDLNHYFEIMNNRGEQLEKHEILKARLMDALKDESGNPKVKEQAYFAQIWDACSQMDGYVQKHFSSDERKALFGDDLAAMPDNFSDICFKLKDVENVKSKNATNKLDVQQDSSESGDSIPNSILTLLAAAPFHPVENDEGKLGTEEKYESIINFPNFLLHVLRIVKKEDVTGNHISLDDKQLLPAFYIDANERKSFIVKADKFVFALLKCRVLFDQYVIKRHSEARWSLIKLKYNNNNMSEVNTFGKEEDESITSLNKQIIMVQSMFHVSYPTQNYKYWLNGLLDFLYDPKAAYKSGERTLTFMESLSDRFFFGRFGKIDKPVDYDVILSEKNTDNSAWIHDDKSKLVEAHLCYDQRVHHFIFNRLDYLIWKAAKENNPLVEGLDKIDKKKIESFTFSFRSSVEHYYPRHPLENHAELENVDRFGNLCLISSSKNSKLSNNLPQAKKDHYAKSSATESLKQQLMMTYDKWDNDNVKNINNHEQSMIALLASSVSK